MTTNTTPTRGGTTVNRLPLSDPLRWLALLLCVGALAVTLWPSAGASSAYSIGVIHRTNVLVRATLGCQDRIAQRHYRTPGTYAKTSSMHFRRRARRLWGRRFGACHVEDVRIGVPPWFRRVMLCIHPKESSDWKNAGHHEGGLQFAHSTWVSAGGQQFAAHAYEASPNEQIRAAYDLTKGSTRGLSWHWAATIGGCL
jgi:hypothetical protein